MRDHRDWSGIGSLHGRAEACPRSYVVFNAEARRQGLLSYKFSETWNICLLLYVVAAIRLSSLGNMKWELDDGGWKRVKPACSAEVIDRVVECQGNGC